MVIDCHIHLNGAVVAPEVMRAADRLGVQWLCASSLGRVWQYEPAPEICVEANNDVAEAMRRHAGRILGFCMVNPAYPEAAMDEFRRCIEQKGMSGLKLWVAVRANDARVFPLVEQAIAYRVPVLQHSWHKVAGNLPHESEPEEVAELARRHPEADIIMAHIAGEWRRGIHAVRDCPNLYVDTSGTIVDAGMVETAVKKLGARRVLFGSDADGVDLAAAYGKIAGSELSVADKARVLGLNMQMLLAKREGG